LEQSEIDALRTQSIQSQQLLINGRSVGAKSNETLAVTSPIDGSDLTTLAHANESDVQLATGAARKAFDNGQWSRSAPAYRKKILFRLAELIEAEALSLAVLGVRDNGTEIGMAYKAESLSAAATFRFYAEAIDKLRGDIAPTDSTKLALVHREPVGVVGVIVPWNFPLMIGAWKIAPALAAGNTVVLKPSETASLSLLRLVQLAHEAGIPDGVLNIVTGPGATTGKALALSHDVDVLVFTGSGATGRKLLEYSAQSNLKRVYLELGGKSPNIVFSDAPDLEKAAKAAAAGIFRNSGQVCVAGSRLLVEQSIADEFTAAVNKEAAALTVGDPLDLKSDVGAVHSEAQLQSNLGLVELAESEGALSQGGGERILTNTGGTYMSPVVFTNVAPETTLFQQEVFGPVLAVTPFADEQEAVALANETTLGLASGVWTQSLSRAHRMVEQIRAGVVHVNCYGGVDITVPMGGQKQSGNGYDKSLLALDKFTQHKTAWIQL